MEFTGAAIRRSPASASPMGVSGRRRPSRVSCIVGRGGGGFADEGHLVYYEAPPRKTVEAVARDLAKIRAMGLVAGDAAKEKVLSEATELLLQELNQMKDEEDTLKKRQKDEKAAMKALNKQQKEAKKAAAAMNCEDDSLSESSESDCDEEQLMKMSHVATASMLGIEQSVAVPPIAASDIAMVSAMVCDKSAMKAMKKREKEQKKAAKKAMKMKKKEKMMANCCKNEDSSSSSSESSNSECEGEVIRMSRCTTIAAPQTPPVSTLFPIIVPQIPESATPEPCQDAQISPGPANAMWCTSSSSSIAVVEKPVLNRIEVCMGGKCKKSGSLALLQEFEKKVGMNVVAGCKCMGKCGLGPNVRLRSEGSAEGSVQKDPLYIGVGLEDVGTIVAGFFGDSDLGMN